MAFQLKSIAGKTAGLTFGDGLNASAPDEEIPNGPSKGSGLADGLADRLDNVGLAKEELPAPISIKPTPDNVEVHSSKLADFYMEGRSPRSPEGSPLLTPTSARKRVAFAEPPSPVPIATVEKEAGNSDRNFWRKKSLRRLFSESKNVHQTPSRDDVRLQIVEESMKVLRYNDLGGYTVPAHGLYPFQWNWDSAIVASGWAVFDEARAWQEIESLFSGQWEDGMVPSIVFHKPSTTYFPGPEIWGTKEKPSKSTGITQPPVAAMSVRFLYEHADDPLLAMSEAGKLFPKLLAWHRWFYRARDPSFTGVVAILHPWESGMDNSPAWDEPMRFPIDKLDPYERCDLNHVHPEMRPTKETYDHYLTLLYRFKNANFYDPDKLYHISPFRVTDLCVNCILFRANRDLRWLANKLGRKDVVTEIDTWLDKGFEGFESLWDEEEGIYKCRDQITGKLCPAAISAGFLPLFAGVCSEKRAARLVQTLERWLGGVTYGVPSIDPEDRRFEPLRYWRGPVWIIINWMISNGLKHYGYDALANRIKDDSIALTSESGLFEYFNPVTGEGEGGHDFSWTAAMSLAWMDRPAAIAVGSRMHGPKQELGSNWTATPNQAPQEAQNGK